MVYQGRTWVYEFFDHRGRHLYIGITNSIEHRFAQHEADKWWWKDVDHSRTRVTCYPTRAKALRVEKRMIRRHRPPGNTQHNPDAGRVYRSRSARRRRPRVRQRPPRIAVGISLGCAGLALLWTLATGAPPPPGVLWTLVGVAVVAGFIAPRR